MAYRRSSNHPVATRLFRPEHQSKIPANRQLGSYADRDRRHTRHIAATRGYTFVEPEKAKPYSARFPKTGQLGQQNG